MKPSSSNRFLALFILFIVALVSLPYIYAAQSAGPDHVFAGFLMNPLDGNSYLAKMQQGWDGGWQFTLPYTAQPGQGAYLFLFYLFLGHLARLLGLSLLLTFHLARVVSAVILSLSLYRFCAAIFSQPATRWLAFALASLGSGLGWLVFGFLGITSDLWVAEAYPFLSAYATPHFALGMALQLWLLHPRNLSSQGWRQVTAIVLSAFALAVIAPFAIPVVLVVWGGMLLWKLLLREKFRAEVLLLGWISLGSLPVLLYDYWVASTHPVLSGWNAQNLTPSPPPWDLLVSLSPAIFLAVAGILAASRLKDVPARLLLSWTWLCLILLYVPFSLQRRFFSGFYVPIALLAAWGVQQIAGQKMRRFRLLVIVLFILALPTNLLVVGAAVFGAQQHDLGIYLTTGEAQALSWINHHVEQDAVVLAAPDTGLFIPAHSRARVLYGHPFETVDAAAQEAAVTGFFSGALSPSQAAAFLTENHIAYIFVGPREQALGSLDWLASWQPVYSARGVSLYQVSLPGGN
ncbi:MAG: hypothetical protein OEZ02_06235 [Anaerolineae bacterium]|nr:hypothetical protein [Anaerolineae bacterium]